MARATVVERVEVAAREVCLTRWLVECARCEQHSSIQMLHPRVNWQHARPSIGSKYKITGESELEYSNSKVCTHSCQFITQSTIYSIPPVRITQLPPLNVDCSNEEGPRDRGLR